MDISNITKAAGALLRRNSSSILTGLGVAGSLTSAVLAVKATPRVIRKLDAAYLEKNGVEFASQLDGLPVESLTKREVIAVAWRDYVPALGVEILTITSIIGAQSINLRRQATLVSLVGISETALREYQERMAVEAPTKDRKVRDDIARKQLEDHPVNDAQVIIVDGGDQLFYDSYTDRYFKSSMQRVQKAINDINARINNQQFASLNELYDKLGLKHVSQGDDMGWTPEHVLEMDYSTHMTEDDRSAIVLTYYNMPIMGAWKGFL